MNSSIDEIKDDVKQMLRHDQDEQAVELLMSRLRVNREQADKLCETLWQEIRSEESAALKQFKDSTIASIKSSIPLLLKGSGVVFGIMSVLVLASCSIGYYLAKSFESAAAGAQGTIVDFHTSSETGEVWLIVDYEFHAEQFSIESLMTYEPQEFQTGQTVSLLVRSSNPSDAVINSFKERFLAIYVIGGVALGILIFSIFLWIAGRRYGRRLAG